MLLSSPDNLRAVLSLETACEDAPYGLLVLDASLHVRYANNTAAALLGFPLDEMIGQPLFGIVPHAEEGTRPLLENAVQSGATSHLYEFATVVLGREAEGVLSWDATFSPIRQDDRIIGALTQFVEVTARVHARQQEQAAATELDAVFQTITDGLIVISAQGQITRINPAGERILRGTVPVDVPLDEVYARFHVRDPETGLVMPNGDRASQRALRGETVLGQEQLLRDGTGTDIILSVNAAPLPGSDPTSPRGAIALFRDITHVKRLQAESSAAHARARRIAQTLQASLMPSVPLDFEHHTMGVAFQAAWVEEADVGGDLLEFFTTKNGTQAHILVADVSGKGLVAARRTAQIKYTVKALALTGMDIRSIVTALNDAIADDTEFNGFVTLFYAILSVPSSTMQFINAGHEPGLLWNGRSKQVRRLAPTGMPLGVLTSKAQQGWTVGRTRLLPSDALLVYTDGFTEAPGIGTRRLLGETQAEKLFQEALRLPTGSMGVNYILSAIHAHAGPRLRDDLALMLLRGNQVPPELS